MHPSELLPHLQHRAQLASRVLGRRLRDHPVPGDSVERFHRLYYESEVFGGTWRNTFWMGIPIWKCPFDLWVYQELLHELRPQLVIETGTAWGGSALFLASMLDLVGHGSVLSIDLHPRKPKPLHPRIRYLKGSSTDPRIVAVATEAASTAKGVMVILDSDHSCGHVRHELELYAPLVVVGGYVVVEDTNINGHPVVADFGPGPMEAVDQFLSADDHFGIDREREKFGLTMNPRGFLQRLR
ncbi:MAG: cephalosporin hydroxylase family protein [Actinomycetota bacterium]|nr:cephalosporin hydroxylase family protein [Actinomycetota bacterium]